MTPLIVAFALALQVQYVLPPYAPYAQPSPYAPQAYPVTRGQPYFPPTLPPGSPSLMIPNPPAPAYPPQPYQAPR